MIEIKSRIVSCMFAMASGVGDDEYPRYGGRTNRIQHVLNINQHSYKILTSLEPTTFSFSKCKSLGVFNLGYVEGFSAILPLTEVGYDAYAANDDTHLSARELEQQHIIVTEQSMHSATRLLLAGLYFFPAICRNPSDPPAKSFGVIANHLHHFWLFLPKLSLIRDPRLGHRIECPDGLELPKIFCPISGKGLGGSFIKKLGFDWRGTDKVKLRKELLDFKEINDTSISSKARQAAVLAVRYINQAGRRRPWWI